MNLPRCFRVIKNGKEIRKIIAKIYCWMATHASVVLLILFVRKLEKKCLYNYPPFESIEKVSTYLITHFAHFMYI
jgi:hypothetical protein